MLSHYIIPLAPFLLIALNSALCLFFVLYAKHDMRAMQLRWKRLHTSQKSTIEVLKIQIAELSERVLDAEDRTGVLVPPAPPQSGLNLNKRTQAIRMSRRGEQPDKIAAALSLPQREIELLLKVHRNAVYTAETSRANANSTAIPASVSS